MAKFGPHSMSARGTCHPDMILVADSVVKNRDCRMIYGWRGPSLQNEVFRNGFSTKEWPNSMHNVMRIGNSGIVSPCSFAMDLMPFFPTEPFIRWNDTQSIYEFSGYTKARGDDIGVDLTHGYDWDDDLDFHDQTFMDGAHYQFKLGQVYGVEIIRSNDNSISDIESINSDEIPSHIALAVEL